MDRLVPLRGGNDVTAVLTTSDLCGGDEVGPLNPKP
jgi:hypothetical protein